MVYSTITQLEVELSEKYFPQVNSTLNENDELVVLSNSTSDGISQENAYALKVKISTALCFWCGFIQVLFSALGFGRISKYMPQPLLRAFSTAAAFHVLTSQIRHVFGIYYQHKFKTKYLKLFRVI